MRTLLVGLGICTLLVGCSDERQALDETDPFKDDSNDPMVCIGDPDTGIVCKKESEFWDCTTMPNGEVKCSHQQPQTPGGGGTWTCEVVGSEIVCKSKDATSSPDGGSGWSCSQDGEFTVCKKDAPALPSGGGTWNCTLDDEFNLVCTSTNAPPPVTPPPDNPALPPGGGNYMCYEAAPGTTGLPIPPEGYWAKVIAKKVLYQNQEAAYVRIIFSKAFVDNTYGANSLAYTNVAGKTTGHSFGDLVESDKAEVFFKDAKGDLVKHMAIDYISPSSDVTSGYKCLGVSGGEGAMLMGAASDVLAAQSSLSLNFNHYGYVLTKDSPKTDQTYKADPAYPSWIWEVWYEVWVKWSSFTTGVGKVYITGIHASPSKVGSMKLDVVPVPCP